VGRLATHPPTGDYATAVACEGARVRGRPAVSGCCGSGMPTSDCRCCRARAPTVISWARMTTAAYRAASTAHNAIAAMPAKTSDDGSDWATVSTRNDTVMTMTSRSMMARTRQGYATGPRDRMPPTCRNGWNTGTMTTSQESLTPSSRIVIIGGTGKVAREIIRQLHTRGDEPVAIFRNADRSDELAELGAVPVVLDIESASVEELAEALAGADAVVFSAGAGGGDPARTRAVDFEGAVTAIAAAARAEVSRFVIVSAIGAGGPELPGEPGDSMRPYYEAKHDADVALSESSLDWTIVRPGGLTDEPATGRVTVGEHVESGTIPRADVAAFVIAALDDARTIRAAWELVSGEQSIAEAIDAAV
jgi:uncharacterized protein YbjT (DUF2867 family)